MNLFPKVMPNTAPIQVNIPATCFNSEGGKLPYIQNAAPSCVIASTKAVKLIQALQVNFDLTFIA